MYKAVVSDLDGTLLNENHVINDFTIEVVKKVIEKRNKILYCYRKKLFGSKRSYG